MSLAAVALAVAAMVAEPTDGVRDAVERAEAHYVAEEYDEASQAFGEAYAIDPSPVYLYARAQAERLAGRCAVALDLYDRYLDSNPPEKAAKEARINRARCGVLVQEPPPPEPPDPGSEPAPTPVPERPWYRDPLGGSLVGVGGVTTVIGAGILGISIANDREASKAPSEDEFINSKDSARARYRAGVALVSIGVAVTVGGVVRWALLATKGPKAESQAESQTKNRTVWFDGAGVRGRF